VIILNKCMVIGHEFHPSIHLDWCLRIRTFGNGITQNEILPIPRPLFGAVAWLIVTAQRARTNIASCDAS
jgi:hypothetical protein